MNCNELGEHVPADVVEKARSWRCKQTPRYVYRDGEYGPGYPAASIGPNARASRFRSSAFELWKVELCPGWVAFEQPGMLPNLDYDPNDDPWVAKAIPLVEDCINEFVRCFLDHPYLHRVEHSFHCHLMNSLMSTPLFSDICQIGTTGQVTQLIHKEWPETIARENRERGNFDIAVLSPALLASCNRLSHFADGLLPAPIVVELGLNYRLEHYEQDRRKLVNSNIHRGYLVHLLRECADDVREKTSIESRDNDPQIQTAFGRFRGAEKQIKLLSDPEIVTYP